MTTKKVLLAAVMCLVLSLCPLLYGQANGTFSGTVADKTGSVIPGASVKITSQGTGLIRDTKTDSSGHYLVPLLPVAFYTIHVEAQGFQTTEQKDVRLQVDEQREIDFSLNPASITQNIEVSATEVAVETTNPTLGQVITSEEVADLPLNGRNFVQLATLTPGTTQSTNPASFFASAASSEAATRGSFSLSVGGSREQSTDWLLDGNDNNQLDEGGIGIFSDIDDIQEFKVLAYNYSAEYGERAGPTVLVTTKSGSNQFHGTAFEFFRNTNLDAKTPFVGTATKFNLNQYGGSIGGPIRKDKTFFFLDYQAKVQRKGVPFTGYVPTAAMITPDANGNYDQTTNPLGITTLTNPYPYNIDPTTGTKSYAPFICSVSTGLPIAPVLTGPLAGSQGPDTQPGVKDCLIIPGSLVNPIGRAVAQLYPTPTPGIQAGVGYNYANQPIRRLNEGTGDIRVDHNLSSHDSLFGRFSYDQATNYIPGGSPTWAAQNAFGTNQSITNHGRNAVISEQHVFSASTINQFTAGFNRIFNHILSYGDFAVPPCEASNLPNPNGGAPLIIPGANLDSVCAPFTGYPTNLNQASNDCISCGMTSFQMGSYFSLGDRGYAPYQGGTNVYSVGDTVDFVRGRHDIRVGATYRAEEMNIRNNAFQDGYIVNFGLASGDDIADLLLGSLGSFAAHDQTFLGGTVGRRYKVIRPFVQDDFRVTSNLTLNLGLAWAIVTPETEVRNRQANFDVTNLKWYVPSGSPMLSACGSLCIATDGRVGIQMDKTALEPRIGFAWKPAGRQNLVIRGGYAIYHDSSWDQGGQGLWQNPPYYAEVDPYPLGVCAPFGSTGCGLSNGFLLPANTPSTVNVTGGAVYNAPVNPGSYTGTIQSMNRNFSLGSVQQFNLNVEQELPGNVVFTLGYAGTRSRHILVSQLNENITSPSACYAQTLNGNFQPIPNPLYNPNYSLGCGIEPGTPFGSVYPYGLPFQVVATNNSIGSAQYDSLQAKLETKSVRHGLYALLGYTWSRNFDTGLTDGLGTNPGALYYPLPGTARMDWGLSQLNLNDSFTASVLYDLPFGKGKQFGGDWGSAANAIAGNWHVNVIERATSGFPLFVVDSSDLSGIFFSYNGLTVQRPNQVGNPNVGGPEGGQTDCPATVHTLQHWFNPCAFEIAPAGEIGTAARAPVYGPRFVNTDFSIFKDFPMSFREGTDLQFRAEFFNLLNHSQYWLAGISGTGEQDINTPSSFGKITQTLNNPRLIQFGLKLQF
ncbi:MAG: carboxypeptidase-like regulatory domain-containing protein [Terriglobales bacterium]